MATRVERLPYGVGRLTPTWWIAAGLLLAGVGIGVFAWSRELSEGMAATGLRDIGPMGGATWGLYIAFVVYFVGLSFAGISVAALIRLANIRVLKPIARMGELLAVVSLVLGGLAILADLGQPLRGIVHLFRYARPQSPFFGTFTLVVSGYLLASLVYLYLDARRDLAVCARVPGRLQRIHRFLAAGYADTPEERERRGRASFWLAIAIVPLLVTAHSTLGFVFGLQVGRPGWFSALQAPAFVILAGVSGLGMLIVIAALARRTLGEQDRVGGDAMRWLGNALMLLLLAYLYFMAVELLTTAYSGEERERQVIQAILTGEYAWIYWTSVGSFAIALALLIRRYFRRNEGLTDLVTSGVLVNLAAIGKRFLIVVPSQTHGTLLPYDTGSYTPAWTELAVVGALIALGALLFILAAKVLPILPVRDEEVEG